MKKLFSAALAFVMILSSLLAVSVSADGSSERIDLSGTQTLYESATGEWSSGKIVAKDENGNEITKGLSYSSNYDFVLTVSADGTVTPKHEGCAIVTVTKENPDKTTVSAKIALNVTKGAKHNNRFESGNDLKLNFSRSGNHCVNPSVNSANKSINIQTQSWTSGDTYKRFFIEAWFYDDGVISETSEIGAAVNFNSESGKSWETAGYGNVSVGVLDKSSRYYGYKNINGSRTWKQYTPSIRNKTAFLNGLSFAEQYSVDKYPYKNAEAYIERSRGWHQIAILANANTENRNAVKYYLDGIELFTDNFPTTVNAVLLYAANGAYYDDVVLSTYTDTDFENTGIKLSKPQIYEKNGTYTVRASAEAPYEFFKTAVVATAATAKNSQTMLLADGKINSTTRYYEPTYSWDGTVTYEWETSSDAVNWTKLSSGASYTPDASEQKHFIRAKATLGEAAAYSDIVSVGTESSAYNITLNVTKYSNDDSVAYNVSSLHGLEAGSSVEFTVTPAAGSVISSVMIDNSPLIISGSVWAQNKFFVTNIQKNTTVDVVFAQRAVSKPLAVASSTRFETAEKIDGHNCGVIFQKINPGYGWNILSFGADVSDGKNTVRLAANTENGISYDSDGFITYGIKAYGAALDNPGTYIFSPYAEVSDGLAVSELDFGTDAAKSMVVE
ncbi:MAG: hypothetical protein SPL89_09730 [Clostridia bacterium]|nr:hypothetical protein [Clostridia bacterium]